MKKFIRIAAFLLSAVLVSSAAGCSSSPASEASSDGSNASESSSESAVSSGEKVTLRMWQRNSGSGGPLYEYLQDFNASQDKIEVIYEGYGENYGNVVNIALNSDDPPDIFEIQSTMAPISDFAQAGHIVDLDDLLTEDFKAQFNPSTFTQKDFSYEGKTYAIPLRLMHFKLIYNKDLFEKANLPGPPETLEEMREYARIITEQGGGTVYGMGVYTNYNQFWVRYIDQINIASGYSGPYGFDFKTGKFDFSTQKKAFQYWVDLYNDGSLFPGAVTLGVEQMRANFAQGNVGMMIDGNWMTTQYAMNIETDVNWDAAPIPIFEGEERAKDYMSCDITFAISAKGDHIAESKEVYKNILENQMKFRDYGECDTKTFTAANEESAFQNLPKEYVFQGLPAINDVSNHSAFSVEPQKFITLEGDNRDTVLNNQFALAIDGQGDLDAALADLTERYNAALDKAVADGLLSQDDLAPAGFDYYTR